MGKRERHEREHLRIITRMLNEAGIAEISSIHRTNSGHLRVEFVHDGFTKHMVLSGSGDWKARQQLRQQLRHLLRGHYQQRSQAVG